MGAPYPYSGRRRPATVRANTKRRLSTVILVVVITTYIALALTYNAIIPLCYGPDENRHYGYIQHLVLYRSLPRLGPQNHPILCHMDPRPPFANAIHPPLYYALLSPVYRLLAGNRIDCPPGEAEKTPFTLLPPRRSMFVQHLLRGFSLLMGLISLWFVHRIARWLFDDAWQPLAVTGFVALLPHFLMLSAVMNNDTLTILLAHAFLFLLVRQVMQPSEPTGEAAALGLFGGAMLLSKASMLAWMPLLLFGAWHCHRRLPANRRWSAWALTIGLPALIAGWWYVRFYMLYGRIMPIVKWVYEADLLLWSPMDLLTRPDAWRLIWRFLAGSHRSLWSQVDWFILKPEHVAAWQKKFGTESAAFYPYSEMLYALLVLLTFAMLIGWGKRLVNWMHNRTWTPRRQAIVLLAAAFGLLYLALMHYTLFTHPGGYEGGRYLLPSIGAFSVLFWWGLMALAPEHWQRPLIVGVLVLLFVLNLLCIANQLTFTNPLYAPPGFWASVRTG